MKVVLAALNAKYIHSSLALFCLARYCRELAAFEIKEYSINQRLLDILGEIYEAQPDVVGLACYIWNIEMTLELAGLLKQVLPASKIVLGGPEVSYDPAEILSANPGVDVVICGEGEAALHALLTQCAAGAGFASAPGLAFRRGERVVAAAAARIENLADLPFPYDEGAMAALRDKIIYYESARGCPFACRYCLSGAAGDVRLLPVERVLTELRFFIRYGVRQVKFVDRTFNADKKHCLAIWRFLAAQIDCVTNFHFEIAAELLDEEILAALATLPPGRVQLEIGVQSTNAAALKAVRRTQRWDKTSQSIGRIVEAGNIHVHLDLIVGLPHEDYASFGQSFNDVYGLRPHMLQIGFLKLLKGSGIRAEAAAHGYLFTRRAPYHVLANRRLSYGEVRRLLLLEQVFELYYNSGRFPRTLACCVRRQPGGAFAFYEALARYWRRENLHRAAHSAASLYGRLLDFCRAEQPEIAPLAAQLLKFDALAENGGTLRPAGLPWNEARWSEQTSAFWRDEATAGRYLADYRFTTWRELKKRRHIEVFSYDLPRYFREPARIAVKQTPVLFDFGSREVVIKTIRDEDFWRRTADVL